MSSAVRARSGAPVPLIGRGREVRELADLLDGGPRSAVLLGFPGSGRTAVLDTIAERARAEQRLVLQAAGRAADRTLPLGVLGELLAAGRGVHGTARGWERLLERTRDGVLQTVELRLTALAWLEEVAGTRSLLLVIDDAQWVDPETMKVLAFVAHRAARSRLALVFAVRGDRPPPDLVDLPAVVLPPLDDRDAALLLRIAEPELDPVRLAPIVERAAGNPLALLELTHDHAAAALDPVELPTRLADALAADLPALPPTTRRVLLLAVAGNGDLAALARIVGDDPLLAALEPAEAAGLIRVHGRTVRFRHPLLAQAVLAAATAAERVSAHRALADVAQDDPDRRAWHRAEATLAPDESVAEELAAVAQRAADRVEFPSAARAMRRAVELTPDPETRERRLLALLEVGLPTGQAAALVQLARRLRDETRSSEIRVRAQQLIAFALTQQMDQTAARIALEEALEAIAPVDRAGAWATLTSLAVLVYDTSGDPGVLLDWSARLDEADAPEDAMIDACRWWVLAAADPLARPAALVAAVRDAVRLPADSPPLLAGLHAMLLGATSWLLDEPERALAHLTEARSVLERANSSEVVPTLVALAQVQTEAGLLDGAEATARTVLDVAEAQGLAYRAAVARHDLAAVAALRGDRGTARRLAEDVLTRIDLGSWTALEIGLRLAIADSWFGQDDAARWDQLRAAFDADGRPRHGRLSVRALVPAVDAGVRSGHEEEARLLLEGVERALPGRPGAHQAMVLAHARALLAPEDRADGAFRLLVDEAAHARWPLELATARLDYGRWLRQRGRDAEARSQLLPALRTFERIGAGPRIQAAQYELRSSGGAVLAADRRAWTSLTPQERQVVRLAASGGTNRQIGETLHLSPRTVGVHLYNAFPKLGVTARRQLREVVERLDR